MISLIIQIHLKVKINISKSETAMQVLRIEKQTWLLFMGSLLGSVFGLMASVAGIMKGFEGVTEKYKKISKLKNSLNIRISKASELRSQIFYEEWICGGRKVVPSVYEIRETQGDKYIDKLG